MSVLAIPTAVSASRTAHHGGRVQRAARPTTRTTSAPAAGRAPQRPTSHTRAPTTTTASHTVCAVKAPPTWRTPLTPPPSTVPAPRTVTLPLNVLVLSPHYTGAHPYGVKRVAEAPRSDVNAPPTCTTTLQRITTSTTANQDSGVDRVNAVVGVDSHAALKERKSPSPERVAVRPPSARISAPRPSPPRLLAPPTTLAETTRFVQRMSYELTLLQQRHAVQRALRGLPEPRSGRRSLSRRTQPSPRADSTPPPTTRRRRNLSVRTAPDPAPSSTPTYAQLSHTLQPHGGPRRRRRPVLPGHVNATTSSGGVPVERMATATPSGARNNAARFSGPGLDSDRDESESRARSTSAVRYGGRSRMRDTAEMGSEGGRSDSLAAHTATLRTPPHVDRSENNSETNTLPYDGSSGQRRDHVLDEDIE